MSSSSAAARDSVATSQAHTEEAESDDQEVYTEEDVLAGDIITTDEVCLLSSSLVFLELNLFVCRDLCLGFF